MNLEIVKYRTNNKEEFLGSINADWLSELINKSTLETFSEKYKLPETGRNLLREVDYENLSGVSNLNLCDPNESLIYLDALIRVYKSDQFNYHKLFNAITGKPLNESRVFIQGKMVNLPIEFYHGFSLEHFFEMKRLEYDSTNLRINKIVDIYINGEHKIVQGESIEIEIRELNTYDQRKDEIQKTIAFIRNAALEGYHIQIMAC